MSRNIGIGEVYTERKQYPHFSGLGVYDPYKVGFFPDQNGKVLVDDILCSITPGENLGPIPSNYIIFNGKIYENNFYTVNDGTVRSTFVDEIALPDGYKKFDYIYNRGPVSTESTTPLITTTCTLPKNYGHVFWSCKQNNAGRSYGATWRTGYINENTNCTRCIMSSQNQNAVLIYSDMRAGSGGTAVPLANGICAIEMTDQKKWKKIIGSTSYSDMTNIIPGEINNDDNLCFISECLDVNLYFLLVVDNNQRVTFCAVPCKNTSTGQYGIYDIVSNQFFGNDMIAGASHVTIGGKDYEYVEVNGLYIITEDLKWNVGTYYTNPNAPESFGYYYDNTTANVSAIHLALRSAGLSDWRIPKPADWTKLINEPNITLPTTEKYENNRGITKLLSDKYPSVFPAHNLLNYWKVGLNPNRIATSTAAQLDRANYMEDADTAHNVIMRYNGGYTVVTANYGSGSGVCVRLVKDV